MTELVENLVAIGVSVAEGTGDNSVVAIDALPEQLGLVTVAHLDH